MPSKQQIIAELKKRKVEHDPNAEEKALAELLEDTIAREQQEKNANKTAKSSGRIVQLTRNIGDRQVGETFKPADAEKLGILEHCKPFEPAK